MDHVIYNKYDCTITVQDFYSEKALITIYENALGQLTFELTDGEVCAELSPKQVKKLIKHLVEIVPHEIK